MGKENLTLGCVRKCLWKFCFWISEVKAISSLRRFVFADGILVTGNGNRARRFERGNRQGCVTINTTESDHLSVSTQPARCAPIWQRWNFRPFIQPPITLFSLTSWATSTRIRSFSKASYGVANCGLDSVDPKPMKESQDTKFVWCHRLLKVRLESWKNTGRQRSSAPVFRKRSGRSVGPDLHHFARQRELKKGPTRKPKILGTHYSCS